MTSSSSSTSASVQSVVDSFTVPVQRILDASHIKEWVNSEGYSKLLGYVMFLNDGVKGKPLCAQFTLSASCAKLVDLLSEIESWIAEIPPIQQPMRFGNKAFRTWSAKLEEKAPLLVERILPDNLKPASVELVPYLLLSFGNKTRLDYGTGHETSFLAYLCCLAILDILTESDREAVVLGVFAKYISVVRRLQSTYMLEPAGSHGVWGLDDYQFLPYIWGSSQLIGNEDLQPKSFTDPELVAEFHKDYLFFDCIRFIFQMKKGPFHEHSPILWDISGVSSWEKVNSGLIKMYKKEVLEKFPVIQHFVFGSLIPFLPSK